MRKQILRDRSAETYEAKVRWFRSLSMAERMDVFCAFTDLILSANPGIAKKKNAEQAQKGVRILSRP